MEVAKSKYGAVVQNVPLDFFSLERRMEKEWRETYTLGGLVSHRAFVALVDRMHEVDTAEVYDMDKTWGRDRLVSMEVWWDAKPTHAAWLQALAAETNMELEAIVAFDIQLHFRRSLGKCINPHEPTSLVVFYKSHSDNNVGVWYRLDRHGDAPHRNRVHLTDQAHPNWHYTCFYCCNRFDRRLLECGVCHQRCYCSVGCQRADWDQHKREHLDVSAKV
jgi:hypothetical protein